MVLKLIWDVPLFSVYIAPPLLVAVLLLNVLLVSFKAPLLLIAPPLLVAVLLLNVLFVSFRVVYESM